MAKNDQEESYERCLSTTLGRVIEFLKFAETKNAALLTFSSAWLLAGISFLSGSSPHHMAWRTAFVVAMCFFAASALVAIYSFLPRLHLGRHHQDPEQKKALLYFGDAATFEPAAYRERVSERYRPPEKHSVTQSYVDDLAVQIVVVSKITARKFRIFNIAACLVAIGLFSLAVPGLSRLVRLALAVLGDTP
ncbi:MAG: hypothetical protein GY873_32360 [Bosea sp.]|uniref:Pycsar system effector family protein n=1 Tax=Bosea sp. (in: a-proteobacteria) TaxID=1871050 RepID=UPI0023995DDC|nr:hypothetical protein [Bosea sp. (in: a-proteobacteria)]MCP4738884.1 hypothetical protein [Bosea sp. (in: a-proteobacteria)]